MVCNLEGGVGRGEARSRGGDVGGLARDWVAAVEAERERGGGGLGLGVVDGQLEPWRGSSYGDAGR